MKNIFVFGTCRVYEPMKFSNYYISNFPWYIDTTSEIIQYIKLKKYDEKISKLIFNCVLSEKDYSSLYSKFINSDILVIEISTYNSYIYNNLYVHGDEAMKYNINYKNHIIEEKELETHLLFLKNLDKKLVIVTHINSIENIKRNNFITLIEKLCKKHSIIVFNPAKILFKKYDKDKLLKDKNHYNIEYYRYIYEELEKYIEL